MIVNILNSYLRKIRINNFSVIMFLILVNFISCQNQENKLNTVGIDKMTDLKGIWVSEKYFKNLIESKNSNLSSNNINLSMINFTSNNKCKIIWNFYEGTDYDYSLQNDTILINFETSNSINKLFFINVNDKLIYNLNNKYIKVETDKIIEKYIFSGNYKNTLNKSIVSFSPNGNILNLPKLKNYSFEIQNSLFDSSLNIIYLNDTKFGYKFNENILEIYYLICSDPSDDESCKIGKQFLKLEKIN